MIFDQCPSVHRSAKKSRGCYTHTFCLKERGHDGDHRGDRKQWKSDGSLVKPPTEPLPGSSR